MLTDQNLIKEIAPHLEDGMQKIYRYAWEAAVIHFPDKESDEFDLDYETELTNGVEVFMTDED